MFYSKIAIRSLFSKWRQYVSLFLVCSVGFGFSLFCLFLVNGMLDSLQMKAKVFYGGDFQFIGGKGRLLFDDENEFLPGIKKTFGDDVLVFSRLDYDGRNAALYFDGQEIRQKVIKGVDFELEKPLFSQMNFISGGIDGMNEGGGILISSAVADKTGAKIGDAVTVMLKTDSGMTNTIQLSVMGIFQDSSVFGIYTTYIYIGDLRKAYAVSGNYANRIGIYLNGKTASSDDYRSYLKNLESLFNMYGSVSDKYVFYDDLLGNKFDSEIYALIPLSANMSELKIVIDAMKLVSFLIVVILVIIVVVGISSTYRVIVMKRITEIGIYKAIGMERNSIYKILLTESSALVVFGSLLGFFLYIILAEIISQFDFSVIPSFDIFLNNGSIVPLMKSSWVLALFVFVLVTTVTAVLFSIKKAVNVTPVQALAVSE